MATFPLVFAVVLWSCSVQGAIDILNINLPCRSGKSLEANPKDCGTYFTCVFGRAILSHCSPGTLWNNQLGLCDFPHKSTCIGDKKKPLAVKESCSDDERFRPDETDCNAYYECSHGELEHRRCVEGLYWNQEVYACDWPNNVNCDPAGGSTSITSATLVTDEPEPTESTESDESNGKDSCTEGAFHSDPSDCNSYYVCSQGKDVQMQCVAGLHWNSAVSACDWPDNANCEAGGSTTTTEGTEGTEGPSTETTSATETTDGESSTSETSESTSGTTESITTTTAAKPKPPRPPRPPVGPPAPPAPQSTHTPITAPQKPYPTIVGILVPPPSNAGGGGPVGPPAPPALEDTPVTEKHKVICYFTDWAWYRQGDGKFLPEDIDPDLCTHVVYAFALLSSWDSKIKPADSWADIDNRFYERVTALKAKGVKVTLGLGGWNDSGGDRYAQLLSDPSKRAIFIESAVAFVKKHGFDGMDIDYEYPTCPQAECARGTATEKPNFLLFMQELRAALPLGSILSAAVSCNKKIIERGYEVAALSKIVDWIGVMTYDIHGAWEPMTGHVSPLYHHPGDEKDYLNSDFAINFWIHEGADPSKLILGIPAYGQTFTLANSTNHGLYAPITGAGEAGEFTRQRGMLSYYEICSQSWDAVVRDPLERMGPYAYRKDLWVSYDDAKTIDIKIKYITDMKLGGAMVWALDLDDFKGKCGSKYPIISKLSNGLNQKRKV